LGFWNEARPHFPTISSARTVAGISGAGAASGGAEGDDEKDGKLMLEQAPRNIASAEATPRLASARASDEPTIFSPKQNPGRSHPAAKRKTLAGAMMSSKLRRRSDLVS
jgi:hypothetical protein